MYKEKKRKLRFKNNEQFGVKILSDINWNSITLSPIYITDHCMKGSRHQYRTNCKVLVRVNSYTQPRKRYLYIDEKGVYIRDNTYVNGTPIYKIYMDVPKLYRKKIKKTIKSIFA